MRRPQWSARRWLPLIKALVAEARQLAIVLDGPSQPAGQASRGDERQSALRSQPGNEDITLETLIDPELLVTLGQQCQMLLHIGGEIAHRDHAVTIGID